MSKNKRNKQRAANPVAHSIYEAFPHLPRGHLDAVANDTRRKLFAVWSKLHGGLARGDSFWQFYRLAGSAMDAMPKNAQAAGLGFACKPGCSFCCKSEEINASFDEILQIITYMIHEWTDEESESFQLRLRASSKTKTMPGDGIPGSPCAFLVDDKCGIHPARPMSCRSYHSADAADCQDLLLGGRRKVRAVPHGRAIENNFWSIARPSGVILFELNSAFKYLFSDPAIWAGTGSGATTENDLVRAGVPHFTFKHGRSIPVALV